MKFIKIHSNQLLKLNKTFLYSSIHFGPAYRNSNHPINNSVRPSLLQQPTLARCPHPGRNLGLGRQSGLPLTPAWAESRPGEISPSDLIRRSSAGFAGSKPARPRRLENPSLIRFLPFLSLRSILLPQRNQQRPRASEGGGAR